jgi:hypothetical protein
VSGFSALPTVASGRPKAAVTAFYNVGRTTEVLAHSPQGTVSLGEASLQPNPTMRPQPIGAAQNDSGEAIVVYMQIVGSEGRVFAVRRSARGEWQPRQQLTEAGAFGFYPQVDIDSHGRAVAVWTQNADGGATYIVGRSISDRGTLGPLFTLGDGSAEFPVVAMHHNRVAVAWDEVVATHNPVYAATSTNAGRTWSSATPLSVLIADTGETAIAMTGSGVAGVVWDEASEPYTGAMHVVGASSRRDGTWTGPTTIADGELLNILGGIATGGTDRFTVAWGAGPVYAGPGANFARVASGRSLDRLGPTVTLDSTDASQAIYRPTVAANDEGVTAVVWEKRWADSPVPSVDAGIMAAVRTGSKWRSPTLVRPAGDEIGYSSVGVDRSGTVTAAWGAQAGDSSAVEIASCKVGGHH